MSAISTFLYVVRFDRLGEAGPAAAAVELVEGREQWLAGYDVHIDSRLIMIPIRILEGTFGSVPLGDLELLRRESRDGLCALRVIVHVCLTDKSLGNFTAPSSDSWLLWNAFL